MNELVNFKRSESTNICRDISLISRY